VDVEVLWRCGEVLDQAAEEGGDGVNAKVGALKSELELELAFGSVT